MELGPQGRQHVVSAAQLALEQWRTRLGEAGKAAMQSLPGLLAEVDQHIAHVREQVADRLGRLHPVTLAAYADGVADAASAKGWSAQETATAGWAGASWPSVRLLAVCVLADATA